MGRKEDNIKKVTELMTNLKYVRNIGTVAHIDHGKTTLSDSLLAGAGLISFELAGSQLALDYDEQEQARGITINAVNASMVHEFEGKEYLINLIDTPGHVDFGGDVTRAMRALDGAIIVVCAVEGVMPQTETVIRQAIKENVKPIIFINKVDRLINELKVTPEQMQERFIKIISELDGKIQDLAPPEFKEEWKLDVTDGSIAFGSAVHKWATSVPFMQKKGISFKDIYDYCANEDQKTLSKEAPVHEVLLDMVIKFLPNPLDAQKYRIPRIWHGDAESPIGKAMISVDRKGPIALMINKILIDPHAGEIAVGRLYSGTIRRGDEVSIVDGRSKTYKVQLVAVAVGSDRMPVKEVVAGNMAAITGVRDAISGATITNTEMEAFEPIMHYSDPVVTVAIEAKNTADLPKLIEVLRSISKADPSIQIDINTETGEHLMAGMGELHLEITQYRIEKEQGVPITASEPIVVYRESVEKASPSFEGKSPNKHNRFMFEVEPLEETVIEAIHDGVIPSGERIKDKKALARDLQELGMSKDESRSLIAIEGYNMFLDRTKGIQYLYETMELVKDAFKEVINRGPLANEKVMGLKVKLVDAKLHEDNIHRGPAQVIPAVRSAIYGAMCLAGRLLKEPKQMLFIQVPDSVMGDTVREIQQRRGDIDDMEQEGEETKITAKVPVSEMFGFSSDIRGATAGRALWSTENSGFERVPRDLEHEVVRGIRLRKGLKEEPYDAHYYAA
jgi:elongation factor 2